MKNKSKIFFLAIIFLGFFGLAKNSQADITLPWSTTYDCADWSSYNPQPNCAPIGLEHFGGDQCPQSGGVYEQITSAANNPNGGGFKGQRHYLGDGRNILTGGTQVVLSPDQNEIWMRWYMRFPLGFAWTNPLYHSFKVIYIDPLTALRIIFSYSYNDAFNFYCYNTLYSSSSADGTGWTHVMSGNTGDGLWHSYEIHLKMDTNGTDGIGEAWVDGVKLIDDHNANWVNGSGLKMHSIVIGHNAAYADNVNHGGSFCTPVDFDDVAINNTGYIGPIGATPDTTPPATPSGLSVQ